MSPKVSVVVMMYRPGGMDITFSAMRDQTFKDFELIIVDNRYEKRHEQVMAAAREYGVRTIHAPEHRRNGKWIVATAAFNTAFALARGEVVIILHDFSYVGPGWIEQHVAHHGTTPALVLGDHCNIDLPKVRSSVPLAENYDCNRAVTELETWREDGVLDEMYIFEDGRFDSSWLAKLGRNEHQWQPGYRDMWGQGMRPDWRWVTLTNDSFPREFLWQIGGIDERYDHGRGAFDHNIGIRVAAAGGGRVWAPECNAVILNPRFLMRTLPFGSLYEKIEGKWTLEDGNRYNTIIQQRGDKSANNPYEMRELARDLDPWRLEDTVRVPRELSDDEYWHRKILPETPPATITF